MELPSEGNTAVKRLSQPITIVSNVFVFVLVLVLLTLGFVGQTKQDVSPTTQTPAASTNSLITELEKQPDPSAEVEVSELPDSDDTTGSTEPINESMVQPEQSVSADIELVSAKPVAAKPSGYNLVRLKVVKPTDNWHYLRIIVKNTGSVKCEVSLYKASDGKRWHSNVAPYKKGRLTIAVPVGLSTYAPQQRCTGRPFTIPLGKKIKVNVKPNGPAV